MRTKYTFSNGLKALIPKLRFKEFTGPWNISKICEVTSYVDYRGKTPRKVEDGIFLVTAKNIKEGYIDYECSKEYVSKDEYSKIMSRGLPEVGDVLITTEAPCGNVTQINDEKIALAQRVIKYRAMNELDNTFLKYEFLCTSFKKKLDSLSSGGTVKGIKGSVLHQTAIEYPQLNEQIKISSFLTMLDNRIMKQQELVDNLKKYKRGLNSKLISGYHKRDYREIQEICNIVGGGTPDTSNEKYWKGEIDWFTPSEIKNKYIYESNRKITELGLQNSSAKIIPINTILLTTRATLGEMSITKKECTTNQGFQSLIVNNNFALTEYVYYMQPIIKAWCYRYSSGNTFREISKKSLGSCKIPIPSFETQKIHINLLSSIDNLIEKNEEIMNILILEKKAFLQQLFI